MHEDRFEFNRGVIRPFQCLSEGWRLIKSEYWFFLGVTFVGLLVAELAPMGILMGPAMCGIHICLLRQANGQRVQFDMLFQGFNYFGQSFVATLCIMVPVLLLVLVYYAALIAIGVGAIMMDQQQGQRRGGPPADETVWLMFGGMGVATLLFIVAVMLINAIFLFVFPLIVDRELTGWEAVKTSFRAAMGNLGGVLGLMLLEGILAFFGLLVCYVGVIFLIPITFAMTAVAYRHVFPVIDPYRDMPVDPEPPLAPRVLDHDTGLQTREPRSSAFQDKPPEDSSGPQP